MTTSEPSRLDRIERILDTLAANQVYERDRRLKLQEEIDLLEQKQRISDERMSRVEASHEQFNEQMSMLAAAQQRNQQQIDQLSTYIGNLAIQVEEISTQAEQDRSQAAIDRAEFRSTVQQILDALRQQYNGNGGRGN